MKTYLNVNTHTQNTHEYYIQFLPSLFHQMPLNSMHFTFMQLHCGCCTSITTSCLSELRAFIDTFDSAFASSHFIEPTVCLFFLNKQFFFFFYSLTLHTACLYPKQVWQSWLFRPFFEMWKSFEVCVWSESLLSYNPTLHRWMLWPVVLAALGCFLPLFVMSFSQVSTGFLPLTGPLCSKHVFSWVNAWIFFLIH